MKYTFILGAFKECILGFFLVPEPLRKEQNHLDKIHQISK